MSLRLDYFTLMAAKSRTPKALTFTSVTRSDQADVVLLYHSGAVGKSAASSASACWYRVLASSSVGAAAAWVSSFSNSGLSYLA